MPAARSRRRPFRAELGPSERLFTESLAVNAEAGIHGHCPGSSANLTVGITANTGGGQKTVSVPVAFISKAHATGLTSTFLAGFIQNVTVTGNVYDYAVPNTLSTPIDVGNIHAGWHVHLADGFGAEPGPGQRFSESLAVSSGSWNTVYCPPAAPRI